MGTDVPCRRLEWDSAFFGFPIARLTARQLTEELAVSVRDCCVAEGIRCLYFLTDAADGDSVRLAEDHGFRFLDARLTLERDINGPGTVRSGQIRPWRTTDLDALRKLAAESHRDSRFWADPRFPRDRCQALYEEWIVKSCRASDGVVFVAEWSGQPAGYITCELEGELGRIGLVAVAMPAQGKGLGRELLATAFGWFQDHGVGRVQVVTQGRNVKAQRLYQACGFRSASVELWYHRWFDETNLSPQPPSPDRRGGQGGEVRGPPLGERGEQA